MNRKIRKIEEKELKEYKQLLQEIFNNQIELEEIKKNYNNRKDNENIRILGYFIDDRLVGTVTIYRVDIPSGKEATIWDLAVLKEYRRQGIALELMQEAEKIIVQEMKINKIWLFSGFYRENAHKLYRKLGYDENRDKAFVKTIVK